jgi:hypothetical protein
MEVPRKGQLVQISWTQKMFTKIKARGFLYSEHTFRRGATCDDFELSPNHASEREMVEIPDQCVCFAVEANTKRVWINDEVENYYFLCVPNIGLVLVDVYFCIPLESIKDVKLS